jgi:hypothetical protein
MAKERLIESPKLAGTGCGRRTGQWRPVRH